MGRLDVTPVSTKPQESNTFIHHLLKDVKLLERMIAEGQLDGDIQRIGAEQEINLIDSAYRPYPIMPEVLAVAEDSHFTHELAQFNGEINADPLPLGAGCFYALENQLNEHIAKLNHFAHQFDAKILLAGILPTIRRSDLDKTFLTPIGRYHALDILLRELRGEPYDFRIEGTDLLLDRHDSTMFESCNTSFQVHLQIPAREFASMYNWAQAIAGPVLSCATNSPILLGKRLWRETRIALFQQAVDTRSTTSQTHDKEPRVSFGTTWLEESVLEIFKEDIARHRVILNTTVDSDDKKDGVPRLSSLSLHGGTIYRWNRPCYGITSGKPHLRIENRYLPAGPTIIDEVANSAFWIGLMQGIPKEAKDISRIMDLEDARTNFLKAARMGLGAQFRWLDGRRITAKNLIIDHLLPLAYSGLQKSGLTKKEATHYLNVIKQRVVSEKTGSQWLLDNVAALKKSSTTDDAIVTATVGMLKRQKENIPVHQWKPIDALEMKSSNSRYHSVSQIMSKDIFSVQASDSVEYACSIMDWRKIHHMLVIDEKGSLQGLLTAGKLVHHITSQEQVGNQLVKEVMIKDPVTVSSDTTLEDAIALMQKHKIGSLPVVDEGRVVGFLSTNDIFKITAALLKK
ncbi:CBS domain-containing protein [Fulvivirga sp. RKSG066]|uniref:CBS domain-containing protein n=1 Tax=Fulvivirga aurantia TaxID=2529383 RepID=UPI0012BBD458|nr:CBS domain-containing protein [Fulvivirga aurantia]MTI22202.1 CBS domain-containing protein [Fulvivirga aurantia]